MPSRALTRIAALAVALPSGLAPSALRLLPSGRFKAADGSGRPSGIPDGWRLDAARAAALVAAAADRQSDYVIDWEHQTLNAAANGQPAPAAGWYKRLEWRRDDGLYAVDVRWTPRAAAMIADGEYRYISPVFSYGADGEVLALGPAALTNNPGLDGLTDLAALSAFFPQEEAAPMKNLLLALGLAETATEAEALAALNALKATHTAALTAAAVADPAQYAPIATLTAIQGELANANTRLATLTAEKQSAEVAAVVAEGLAAGKLTPATKEWAAGLGKANLVALQAFLAAAPVIVKPGDTQSGGRDPGTGAGADGLTETEIAVCKAMGMAQKDFIAARASA